MLYKNAQWDSMAAELETVSQEIIEEAERGIVSQLWNKFKDAIMSAISKHIPKKICKSKEQLPYMTPEIAKMIKRRNRLYKKKKKHQKNIEYSTVNYQSNDAKLKELKRAIQKEMRCAYWSYIEETITPIDEVDEEGNDKYDGMKRFWTFINSVRKDYCGVG